TRCEAVLERVAALQRGVAGRLLERDSVPLWEIGQLASAVTELPHRIRNAAAADSTQLREFVQGQRRVIAAQVALFLGLALLMGAARRRAAEWAQSGETAASMRVFDHPISSALVLTVLVSGWIYLTTPARAVVALGQVLVLVPALKVTRLSLDPTLVRPLYVVGAFFLTELVRHFASTVPLLGQQVFLLEMLAGRSARSRLVIVSAAPLRRLDASHHVSTTIPASISSRKTWRRCSTRASGSPTAWWRSPCACGRCASSGWFSATARSSSGEPTACCAGSPSPAGRSSR